MKRSSITLHKHLTGRAFLGSILWAFLFALPASAQSPGSPGSSDENADAQVTAHYEKGVKATNANQWQKAREEFLAAWQLKHHYQIAANLGRVELKLGMHRDAAE